MGQLDQLWSVLLAAPKTDGTRNKHTHGPGTVRALPRRYRSPVKTAIPSLMLVALGIVAIVGIKSTSEFLASPIQGVVASILPGFYHGGIDMTPRTEANDYAAFAYPRGMAAQVSQTPHGPIVAAYNLTYRKVAPWNLAVSIIRVPTGNLADNSAYKLRQIYARSYSQSNVVFNGQDAVVMTDKTAGGYARVGFLVHGQYQAVVSLTGQDRGDVNGLESTLAMVLGSWRWLKG